VVTYKNDAVFKVDLNFQSPFMSRHQ